MPLKKNTLSYKNKVRRKIMSIEKSKKPRLCINI